MLFVITVSSTARMACGLFSATHWLDLRHSTFGMVGSIRGVHRSIVLLRHCTTICLTSEE